MSFNDSPSDPFVQRCVTIGALLVEGIMRNISMELYRIWTSGTGGDSV